MVQRVAFDPGLAFLQGRQFKDQRENNQLRNRLLQESHDRQGETQALQNKLLQSRITNQDKQASRQQQLNTTMKLATFNKYLDSLPEEQREAAYQKGVQFLESKGIPAQELGASYADARQRLGYESVLYNGLMGGKNFDQQLREREIKGKEERLKFEREKDERELIGLQDAVDQIDIPDEDKAALKRLPKASLAKIIQSENSPKGRREADEAAEKKRKGEELTKKTKMLVSELIKDPDAVKSVVGGIDEFFPTISNSSKDAEAALADLTNLLTVENLGIMSGVLSETDMNIIKSVGAAGLSGSQDRVLENLNRMAESLGVERPSSQKQSGRFKTRRVR